MHTVTLTSNKSSGGRNYAGRWMLFAVLLALLSLQLGAASHVHNNAELPYCEICVQGANAPLAAKIELPAVFSPPLPTTVKAIGVAPTVRFALTIIRDPPTTP